MAQPFLSDQWRSWLRFLGQKNCPSSLGPFLECPSPPSARDSQGEGVRSRAPNLLAALTSDQMADSPLPTCPQRLAQRRFANAQIRCNPRTRQPTRQRNPHRFLLELFTMLDHLVGLLDRVFNPQVTGTKPLQVQSAIAKAPIITRRPCPATSLRWKQRANKSPFLVRQIPATHDCSLKSSLESETTPFGNPFCQHGLDAVVSRFGLG
jgi:hypothetical protein